MTGSPAPGTGTTDLLPAVPAGVNYGVAAGVIHGDVSIAGRAPVRWPCRVGVLPGLVDGRLDRPADHDLAAASAAAGTAVVGQVLSGLGGVGKTQLAAGLAHRLWTERGVDLLVWVNATSRTTIQTTYTQAIAAVTGIDDVDAQEGPDRFLAWLAETPDRRWLIVLDDLTDPNDLTGLWPPASPVGRTVVTTRRRDAALLAGRRLIDVDVFTPDQALRYLQDKLDHPGDRPDRLVDAGPLATDLGYLPLALAQAAAFMDDQDMTCAGYRRRLADHHRQLAELAPAALPDEHHDPVAGTWRLSVDLADRLRPERLARPVLELAALLDPDSTPVDLFGTATVTAYCTGRLGRAVDADDTGDAIRLLHRLSLVNVDRTGGVVRVHGLVQRAVREAVAGEHRRALAVTAADALLELWPAVERDAAHAQPLRAGTVALHRNAGAALWTTADGGHPALTRAGESLLQTGLVNAARDYFQELHGTAATQLGPDHLDTLNARHNLAYLSGELGDAAGAAGAFERLIDDRLRVLGPDHPETLTTRHESAYWRGRAGDPAGAASALERLLDDRLRVLGPDHPDTLTTRHNLAAWRGEAGDPAGAASAFEQLLDNELRVLGPDHLKTLSTRHEMAYWRGRAGDPAGAVSAFEQLLEDRLRVLGPDNPQTLITRHNLVSWRGEAGDPAGAASASQDLLDDYLRVLGPDYPETLNVRRSITRWQGEAGDPAGAAGAAAALLDDYLRVLGPDHPHTLTIRNDIARWRGEVGDPAAAAAAFDTLLDDYLRVLGPDHPHTLTTRDNLAFWRERAASAGSRSQRDP
ncbi:FxSxx-COOH system tetratricopeptide repeat protein [Dactylosporangium sp. NPDC049140]|uniref:FxSxx-COOH system tetratricopeptide repeat protein n=1 Tax=Dactylosporangium sp. NPDC049140 TaxID=3155647 RepID=UPI0033FF623E